MSLILDTGFDFARIHSNSINRVFSAQKSKSRYQDDIDFLW
jgi:hypothetical protein